MLFKKECRKRELKKKINPFKNYTNRNKFLTKYKTEENHQNVDN